MHRVRRRWFLRVVHPRRQHLVRLRFTEDDAKKREATQRINGICPHGARFRLRNGRRRFALRGFVSRPQVQKNNRNSIFIFVNGRLIRSKTDKGVVAVFDAIGWPAHHK